MPTSPETIVLDRPFRRKVWAVSITVLTALQLSVYSMFFVEDYGVALFILTPLYMGFVPTVIFGSRHGISLRTAMSLGAISLAIYTGVLLLFAIEGLLCIVMAAPIILLLSLLGSLLGWVVVRRVFAPPAVSILIMFLSVPITAVVESTDEPELLSATTSIEIEADRATVWQHVVQFPQLDEPTELMFKAGIAYPVRARIVGTGVGAVRYCTFTTGDFVEPITTYDAPRLLAFDVADQPAPMIEMSMWDVDAPHLHGYFASQRGQFKLTELRNGNTLLEGTTWYHHRIKPAFYWRLWSDHIVHAIHTRVLQHIKRHAEKSAVTL